MRRSSESNCATRRRSSRSRARWLVRSGNNSTKRSRPVRRLQASSSRPAVALVRPASTALSFGCAAGAGLTPRAGEAERGGGTQKRASDLPLRSEDATEKHPVTPGSIQPAREMLAQLLLELGQASQALAEFEASQKVDPNRLHGLAGAARAAERAGDRAKARRYAEQLVELTRTGDTERPEVVQIRALLKN